MLPVRQFLRRLWQRRGGIGAWLPLLSPKRERNLADGRAAARARFWDAVREGRREAEAQCARREP